MESAERAQMVEHAGLSARVSVEIGSIADRLPAIHRKHSLAGPLDAVLLDHAVSSYLPDLQVQAAAFHGLPRPSMPSNTLQCPPVPFLDVCSCLAGSCSRRAATSTRER